MNKRTPKVGDLLHGDDGIAVVVEPGTSAACVLVTLIEEAIGGVLDEDAPSVVEAARLVRVEEWRWCTKKWRIANDVEEDHDNYWSADGDGARALTVAYLDGDVHSLADDLRATEAAVSS